MQFTYFATDGNNRVKIGTSNDVKHRISVLQSGSADLLVCIGICDYEENFLHNKFAQYRIRGEWFILSEEIQEWIAEYCVALPEKGYPSFKKEKFPPGYIRDEDLSKTYFYYRLV